MPINGVTDVHVKPPVLGKIRTGIKVQGKNNKEFPKEVPYFVLNPLQEVEQNGKPVIDQKTGKPKVVENEDIKRAIEVLGTDTPTELTVIFPVDPLDPNYADFCISSYLKWWGNGTMKCIGDNESAHFRGNEKVEGLGHPDVDPNKIISRTPLLMANRKCDIESCPQYLAGLCKAETNIRFMLPEVSRNALFQIDTRSWQAITEINTALQLIKRDVQERGYKDLSYVPLKLIRQKRKSTKAKGGENYIIQVRLAEYKLKEENQKLMDGVNSYLKNALPNNVAEQIQIAPIDPTQPNYDLLPQSEHGRYQTGDPVEAIEAEPVAPGDSPEDWIKDSVVRDRFSKLGDLLGTKVTDAKMKARAMKCKSKKELLAYLDDQISTREQQSQ